MNLLLLWKEYSPFERIYGCLLSKYILLDKLHSLCVTRILKQMQMTRRLLRVDVDVSVTPGIIHC